MLFYVRQKKDSPPTLDLNRKIAIALHVSADKLIFDENEHGPDDDLRLHFEAISKLTPDKKKTVKELLEGDDPET
jgi:hypothetical protein